MNRIIPCSCKVSCCTIKGCDPVRGINGNGGNHPVLKKVKQFNFISVKDQKLRIAFQKINAFDRTAFTCDPDNFLSGYSFVNGDGIPPIKTRCYEVTFVACRYMAKAFFKNGLGHQFYCLSNCRKNNKGKDPGKYKLSHKLFEGKSDG